MKFTQDQWRPKVRNVLRYVAGMLGAYGWVGKAAADAAGTVAASPDLLTLATAAVVAVANELWYRNAQRTGGAT